jgi:hypothetical protein
MRRLALAVAASLSSLLLLPSAASAADDVTVSNVIGGPKIVCTPKKCEYDLRCDTISPDPCVYADLNLSTRVGPVLTKFNGEDKSSPYGGVIGSGQSVHVKLKVSAFGRNQIKRYLRRGKLRLPGGWALVRPEIGFASENQRATLIARGTGWDSLGESTCDFDNDPFTAGEPCYFHWIQWSLLFQNVVLRLKG